jgi:hypothetical protein
VPSLSTSVVIPVVPDRSRWLNIAQTVFGENDMALGEDAAMRTDAFVKAPYRFVRLAGHTHWLPNEGGARSGASFSRTCELMIDPASQPT